MSCSAGGLASDCQASCIVKAPNASAWDTSGAGFNESSTVVDRFVYALAEGVLQRSLTAELTSSVNCTADTTCKNSIVAGSGCTLSGVDLTQTCVAQVDFECARQQTSANSADSQSLIRDLVQQHMAEYAVYQPDASSEQANLAAQLLITLGVTVVTKLSLECSVTAEATNAFLCTGSTLTDSKVNQCNYASVSMSCLQSSSEFTTAYSAARRAFTGRTPPSRVARSSVQSTWNGMATVVAGTLLAVGLVLLLAALTGYGLLRRPTFYGMLLAIGWLVYLVIGYACGVSPFRHPSGDSDRSSVDITVSEQESASRWNHNLLTFGGLAGVFLLGLCGGIMWPVKPPSASR